jgi:hypothetical protein
MDLRRRVDFSLFHRAQIGEGANQHPIQCVLGLRQPKRKSHYELQYTVEIKSVWNKKLLLQVYSWLYYYYYYYYCYCCNWEFSLGDSSPYTSRDKTNKNKYYKRHSTKTQYKQYRTKQIQVRTLPKHPHNFQNTSTHYKTSENSRSTR